MKVRTFREVSHRALTVAFHFSDPVQRGFSTVNNARCWRVDKRLRIVIVLPLPRKFRRDNSSVTRGANAASPTGDDKSDRPPPSRANSAPPPNPTVQRRASSSSNKTFFSGSSPFGFCSAVSTLLKMPKS